MSDDDHPELSLAALDAYLDIAPRAVCRAEEVGPFTLFVGTGPWRYYARPTPGHGRELSVSDVLTVLERQRELSQPEALEWVQELVPELGRTARRAGLEVTFRPLMLGTSVPAEVDVPGVRVRVLESDDDALGAALAAVDAGFGAPGTAAGTGGLDERDRRLEQLGERVMLTRQLIDTGHLVLVVAEAADGPVAGGSAIPRGEIAELVGIATLPAWRRQGVGATVTAKLAAEVRARQVRTVILSAGDAAVARVYARAGFSQVASVGEASR